MLQCRCVHLARAVDFVQENGAPSKRDAGDGSEGQGIPAEQHNDDQREP